jgi:hypothetical protein
MLPAHESFEPGHTTGRRVDNRLVADAELSVVERSADVRRQLHPMHDPLVHRRVECLRRVATQGLRCVHGQVGVAQQLIEVAIGRRDGDADAAAYPDVRALDAERRL